MNLLLLNYEYPPLGGGASLQTKLLAEQFAKKGNKVYIITSHYKEEGLFESLPNIIIYRLPVFRKYLFKSRLIEMFLFVVFSFILSLFLIPRVRIERQLSFFLLPTSVTAYLNYKLFNVPYCVSLRGGDVPSFVPEETKYYKYFYNIALMIGKSAQDIVAVSEDLANLAIHDFPQLIHKIRNIDNGINVYDTLPNCERNRVSMFIFAGRLTKQKNLVNVIKSLSMIKWDFIFNIYGDGPLKEELQELINTLSLEEKVFINAWKSTEEIENEMRRADYLILLSQKEGLSMTSLQAYKNGLPIIASKVCGLQNFVIHEKTGYLVDINQSDDYSEVFQQAINNSDWDKMSLNCTTIVKEDYNIKDKADEYLKLLKRSEHGIHAV